MGSKTKTTTNQTQTGQTSGTSTTSTGNSPDIEHLRTMVSPIAPDPSIPYAFAGARTSLDNSFRSPLGAYTSPAVRDAVKRSAGKALRMEERVASESSRRGAQDQAFGQQAHIADLTASHTVEGHGESSGTMQGTQVQTYNPGVGSYISQAAGIGIGLA